ncbi:DUF2634 domain-containing protein [Paenibacillus sp. L3-i20]|uniref:DUF2634 domain-containing protein n=1 Tax=Paenibacillus sp. L3-i20 TaxID=2905833 RepID=UPI001EDDAB18|nr:DUF2634 domain-containing protein [Paenibacillus sp. L3-i20]GKU75652.1 hypothetical protein L3i20_v200490 [Paenibacillus sp. L3-i20]
MIPTGAQLPLEGAVEQQPSHTWKIDFENGRVLGVIDDLQAIQQAAIKILHTERYDHTTYSFDYGIELRSLLGQSPSFVRADLLRRIEEALLQDERIRSIANLSIEGTGDQMHVTFSVITDFGSFDMEREVNLNV